MSNRYSHLRAIREKVSPRALKGGYVWNRNENGSVWTAKLRRFEKDSKLDLPPERPIPLD